MVSRKRVGFTNNRQNNDTRFEAGLISIIEDNIFNIVGERRFIQLCLLAKSAIGRPLIYPKFDLDLSCIKVSVFYADNSKKMRLQSVLTNAVEQHLGMFGYYPRVYPCWQKHYDLDMPVLVLRYAKTEDEKTILDNVFDRDTVRL